MGSNILARNLSQQEPGRGNRHATAACTPNIGRGPDQHHESADEFSGIVARLSASYLAGRLDGTEYSAPAHSTQHVGAASKATLAALRRERMIEHLHSLGPRVFGEMLDEIALATGQPAIVADRIEAFAKLDPELVRALGADRFTPNVLGVVK